MKENTTHQEIKTMQLTYRGNQYTPCNQVEALHTVQIIYRGTTIERTLNSVAVLEERPTQLIYRGVAYTRPATPVTPYQQPRAINWRYQIA
jgi:hypothetical protein